MICKRFKNQAQTRRTPRVGERAFVSLPRGESLNTGLAQICRRSTRPFFPYVCDWLCQYVSLHELNRL